MRLKLPDRRPSVNVRIEWTMGRSQVQPLQVTFGLDAETGAVREVFCADFKAGIGVIAAAAAKFRHEDVS
jgi:hypothetical protein